MRLLALIRNILMTVALATSVAATARGQGDRVREAHLPNGLTVLLKEVHSASVVCTFVWYRVGSRDEATGVTGVSHQLEHMMFKGTQREFPHPGYIDLLVGLHGGENNAFTTSDYTAYYLLLPSDQLDLALRIEADRMTQAAIDPTQLKAEKTVVLSELEGSNNDNASFLYDNTRATAFQYHPYHYPVIGTKWDVQHFTRDEVYAYYRRHYAPNDATVVVVGDFSIETTLARIKALWRGVKPANVSERPVDPEPPQRGERRIVIERAGPVGYLQYMFHIPRATNADLAPLTVLATALGDGRSSRLYKALVESQIATGASTSANQGRDPETFEIAISLRAGVAAPAAEEVVTKELERVRAVAMDEDELRKVKNQTRADFIYASDSVEQQAMRLGLYQTVTGSWRDARSFLDHVGAVTAADVKRVANTYLTTDNMTVGVLVPIAARLHASDRPNFNVARSGQPTHSAGYHAHESAANTPTCGPTPQLPPTLAPGQPVEKTLPNGLRIVVSENHANPTVAISGFVAVGSVDDPPGKDGLAHVTAASLDRGVDGLTSAQIAEKLDFVGSSIGFSAGRERTDFSARTLTEHFDETYSILARCLVHPTFPADEVDKVIGETVTEIKDEADDPPSVATRELYGLIYPDGDPFRHPPIGHSDDVAKLTRDDVAYFFKRNCHPEGTTIVVAGDVSAVDVFAQTERLFGSWEGPYHSVHVWKIDRGDPTSQAGGHEVSITLPDKEQGEIAMGLIGVSRRSPDFMAASLMNLILGGDQFVGRVGKRVRDTEGLAYYAYTAFSPGRACGPWMFRAGVNPMNVRHAIRSAKEEIARMAKSGVTDAELAWAKSHSIGALPLRISTNGGMADELTNDEFYGLGIDYVKRYPALVRAVTKAQVNAAAKRYLNVKDLDVVIAGPPLPPGDRKQ